MTKYLRNKIPYYVQKTKFLQKKKRIFWKIPVGRGQTAENFVEKNADRQKNNFITIFRFAEKCIRITQLFNALFPL